MTIRELEEQLRQRNAQIKELEKEIEELKKLLVDKAKSKEAKTPKAASNYSVSRHEQKRRRKRPRKNSTGRKPKDLKRDLAAETIDLYWYGADRKKCVLRREQFAWRLLDGKAKYVHYRNKSCVDSAASTISTLSPKSNSFSLMARPRSSSLTSASAVFFLATVKSCS